MPRVAVPINEVRITQASHTTAITGTQNDLKFTALYPGPEGNSIRLRYVQAGTLTPLSVVCDLLDITVNLATDGAGAVTSTASDVMTAVQASQAASLLVSVELASGNDGTGVVDDFAYTALAGGALGIVEPSATVSDATNDHYMGPCNGDVILEVKNVGATPHTVTVLVAPAMKAQGYQDRVETINNGVTKKLGPFSSSMHNQDSTNKQIYFDPSASTDLELKAFKVARV